MQAMSKEFTDVVFLKVDVDECEDVASDYNISCMPTFLYLKKSEKVILEVKYFNTSFFKLLFVNSIYVRDNYLEQNST